MTKNSIISLLPGIGLFCGLAWAGESSSIEQLLRDGLYAEEVLRDPAAAAERYEALLDEYPKQREAAASALFRLAEIRLKQQRNEEAIGFYRQLITLFPASTELGTRAAARLRALGAEVPEAAAAPPGEAAEIGQLKRLAEQAPDLLLAPETLENAAKAGQLEVVDFLLAKGSAPENGRALPEAAAAGQLAVVDRLLKSGSRFPDETLHEAARLAVENNRLTVLQRLLDHGVTYADSLFTLAIHGRLFSHAALLLERGGVSETACQTILCHEISNGNLQAFDWFLQHGAKADQPDIYSGLYPLQYTMLSQHASWREMARKLIERGADPNQISAAPENPPEYFPGVGSQTAFKPSIPPLYAAVVSPVQAMEKLAFLLENGADPNLRFGQELRWQPGDPFGPRKDEPAGEKETVFSATLEAENRVALVSFLLDHGAKPAGPERWMVLWSISSLANRFPVRETEMEEAVSRLLKDAPEISNWDPERDSVGLWQSKPRRVFIEQALLPAFTRRSGLQLLNSVHGTIQPLHADPLPSEVDTASLLADFFHAYLQRRKVFAQNHARDVRVALSIRRKQNDGRVAKIPLELAAFTPFPMLQDGDIIEWQNDPIGEVTLSQQEQIQPDPETLEHSIPVKHLLESLEMRARFPVAVDFGDGSREFTVLGTRLFFDPSKPELPWTSVGGVAELALGAAPPSGVRVIVENNGVEEQFDFPSPAAKQRALRPGDRIRFALPPGFPELRAKEETSRVVLAGGDFPYRRRVSSGSAHPSLIEVLLGSQQPSDTSNITLAAVRLMDDGGGMPGHFDPEQWMFLRLYFRGFSLLPHPDLSDIRIRRKNEQEKTDEIRVDLASAIASFTRHGARQDDAKAHDVFLKAGDVVEIRMRAGMETVPWKGFNEQETRFLPAHWPARPHCIMPTDCLKRSPSPMIPQTTFRFSGILRPCHRRTSVRDTVSGSMTSILTGTTSNCDSTAAAECGRYTGT